MCVCEYIYIIVYIYLYISIAAINPPPKKTKLYTTMVVTIPYFECCILMQEQVLVL